MQSNIFLINVDSCEELKNIVKVCQQTDSIANIGVRVDPCKEPSSKLGVTPTESVAVYAKALSEACLFVRGIHMHLGTRVCDTKCYGKALTELLQIRKLVEKSLKTKIPVVDIGGGFPNDQLLCPGQVPAIETYADIVSSAISRQRGETDFMLAIEPGRYIVNDAVVCIAKVICTKLKGTRRWVLCDVGTHHLPSLASAKYEVFVAQRRDKKMLHKVTIGGPLCMGHDTLPSCSLLPALKPEDYFVILNCGAYTMSLSGEFCSPKPAVVLVDGNKYRLIRERETSLDVFSRERCL